MSRLIRSAALGLAIAALAAPAAFADPHAQDANYPLQDHAYQDLRSPDAREAAGQAQREAVARLDAATALKARALAMEKYYSSYDKAQAPAARYAARPADDVSPWPAIGIGLGLIALVGGAVAVAVRTRRRTMRVAV
jgi:hypothetical protein